MICQDRKQVEPIGATIRSLTTVYTSESNILMLRSSIFTTFEDGFEGWEVIRDVVLCKCYLV